MRNTTMYQSTGKPSVAKFRARLEVIRKASVSGRELAVRWNPKGRYAQFHRDVLKIFKANEQWANELIAFIDAGKRRK